MSAHVPDNRQDHWQHIVKRAQRSSFLSQRRLEHLGVGIDPSLSDVFHVFNQVHHWAVTDGKAVRVVLH